MLKLINSSEFNIPLTLGYRKKYILAASKSEYHIGILVEQTSLTAFKKLSINLKHKTK